MLALIRCILIVLGLLLVTPTLAQDEALISNVFSETDLRLAIEDVAAQAGVNIIADPSVQGVITATLDNVTVERALELLLAGTPYEVERTPNYYLVYGPDETTDNFIDVAETKLIRVVHVPGEMARSLLPNTLQRYVRVDPETDYLAITAPPALMERILADIVAIDQPDTAETTFLSLTYVSAQTAADLLAPYLRRYVRVDATRDVLAITAPSAPRDLIVAQIKRLDVPLAPGKQGLPEVYRTTLVKLSYAKAATTLALLPAALTEYVRADEITNTLAVSAPEPLLSGILADIATIDRPRQHIMLDARVVVLERADLLDFGGQWQWPTLTAGTVISDLVQWPWELRIGYTPDREFTNALSLTLNLLTQNNEASIIANPQVLAQDGIESEIRVTTEEYFQIAAQVQNSVTASLEKIETGTILRITPSIANNGTLTLAMEIEVSDVVARGAQNLPVVSRRTARSTMQLENGGTAAVAGLTDSRYQLDQQGVPGLGGLPLLGRAFRTDSLNFQARQVAVFVTATSVDEFGNPVGIEPKTIAPAVELNEDEYRNELALALEQLRAKL